MVLISGILSWDKVAHAARLFPGPSKVLFNGLFQQVGVPERARTAIIDGCLQSINRKNTAFHKRDNCHVHAILGDIRESDRLMLSQVQP
jgi:hypothetical protein